MKRDRAVARRKAHQKRADAAEEELSVARSSIEILERRKGELMEDLGVKTAQYKKELDRLRDSRVYEVTKERVRVETEMIAKSNKHFANLREWWTRYGPFDTAQLLQSQAFGTKNCLEALRAGGRDIPQETIDMFVAREKQFEEEATKLNPGEIPAGDLALSPLRLDYQFVDMRAFVGLDPHGSNADLIDPQAASVLRSSANPSAASTAPSHSEGEESLRTDAPARSSDVACQGSKPAEGAVDKEVLDISDSSASNPEGNQGDKSDNDVGEEVSKEPIGETTDPVTRLSESQPEVNEDGASTRSEDANASQLVHADLSEPSLDGGSLVQEQIENPGE